MYITCTLAESVSLKEMSQKRRGLGGVVHCCLLIHNAATFNSCCTFGDWNDHILESWMLITVLNNNAWQVVSETFYRLMATFYIPWWILFIYDTKVHCILLVYVSVIYTVYTFSFTFLFQKKSFIWICIRLIIIGMISLHTLNVITDHKTPPRCRRKSQRRNYWHVS